jgi:N-acetylglucosamine kinase-like BadF-type ATPase
LASKVFLTIDSGGSKTELALYSEDGKLLCKGRAQGFGLAEDSGAVLLDVKQSLSDFCAGYDVTHAVCNLGGKNKNQIEATLRAAFPSARIRVFRESEGTAGLELCRMYSAEVTLMVGTGAIAIARAGENAVISGGWGANISDGGSGYQLGLDAIRLALAEIDGVGELSLLTKTLTGLEEPPKPMSAEDFCAFRDRVRQSLAPFDRAHIASFARKVYDCARRGDASSLELYKNVGRDLANLVLAAAKKAGGVLKGTVVNGGMVNAKEFWSASFEERLRSEYPSVTVHYITNGIDEATCRMAKAMINEEKGE